MTEGKKLNRELKGRYELSPRFDLSITIADSAVRFSGQERESEWRRVLTLATTIAFADPNPDAGCDVFSKPLSSSAESFGQL